MKKGFSLIELLLALGLIGLLAAMAYPNYAHLLVRTRRLEAETALLNLANRLEQDDDALTLSQTKSLTRWYDLNIQETKNQHDSYKLTAMPVGSQGAQDTPCQALTLTSEGIEGITKGPKGQPTSLVELCWS